MSYALQIYRRLFKTYGDQQWWPAETPFEVMVGAVLTQNTAWLNVEKAINNLKHAGCLDVHKLIRIKEEKLARLLKPSGYFNIKARRLKNFCHWFAEQGAYETLCHWDTDKLRTGLLGVNGIGCETADDILLYAFDRPIFVVDAYTRRLFFRLGQTPEQSSYQMLQDYFHNKLDNDTALFNQYHALIVKHGKDICKTNPKCERCCLVSRCSFSSSKN